MYYLFAAGVTGAMIVASPFFWAPPFWLMAMLAPAGERDARQAAAGYMMPPRLMPALPGLAMGPLPEQGSADRTAERRRASDSGTAGQERRRRSDSKTGPVAGSR